jgi:hypothetical protein
VLLRISFQEKRLQAGQRHLQFKAPWYRVSGT